MSCLTFDILSWSPLGQRRLHCSPTSPFYRIRDPFPGPALYPKQTKSRQKPPGAFARQSCQLRASPGRSKKSFGFDNVDSFEFFQLSGIQLEINTIFSVRNKMATQTHTKGNSPTRVRLNHVCGD
jgi:hypothetical protein